MGIDCGSYEFVVDLRGAVVDAGGGIAELCRRPRQSLLGQPVTQFLRGPGMTAPVGSSAAVTVRADRGSVPGIAIRHIEGERIRITVLPAITDGNPISHPEDGYGRLVDEVICDVQNPLTGIIGFSTLSLLAPSPHRRRYYLDQVTSQAQRCRRMIQSLDRGRSSLIPNASAIDLVAEASLAVNSLCAQLEGHGIGVETIFPKEPVWVTLDPTLYGDAVTAILNRGTIGMRSDYRAREVLIEVDVGDDKDAALKMTFSGANHVNGALRRRFDIDAVPKQGPTMSDIKLRAARDLLLAQGGRMTITTADDGESLCVSVVAPRTGPPPIVDVTATPIPLNLLAMDDDAMLGELYIELLGVSGHSVTACRSLAGAREALNSQHFDAVIADFFFQDGTLPELWAEAAHEHPELRDRLLIITGEQANPRAREWLARDHTPMLVKPFSARSLMYQLSALTG